MACDTTIRVVKLRPADQEGIFTQKVMDKAGCNFIQLEFPGGVTLERRMHMLTTGQLDIIIGVNKRPEREAIAHFSIPIKEELVRLWVRKEDLEKYSKSDLSSIMETGATLLAPDAGWYGPDYEAIRTTSKQIVLFSHIRHGVNLLLKERGDLLLGADNFEQFFLPEEKEQLATLPLILNKDYLRLMYSKVTVPMETVKLIDKAILELRKQD